MGENSNARDIISIVGEAVEEHVNVQEVEQPMSKSLETVPEEEIPCATSSTPVPTTPYYPATQRFTLQ